MKTDEKRLEAVFSAIHDQTDYSLIEKLEFVKTLQKETEFKNFIFILLILVEKSKWTESAATLLLKKVYNENVFCNNGNKREYGVLFLNIVKEKALSPYVNITTVFRRLISSIIYDTIGKDTQHIVEINSKEDLLATNEFFLEKHLQIFSIDRNSMSLYYNCVKDIHNETSQITISEVANMMLRKKIYEGGLIEYLHLFIRPLYTSSSPNFEGASNYVPEPFYIQIFGSHDNFMNLINTSLDNKSEDNKLLHQIKKFMEKLIENTDKGSNFVDLKKDMHVDKELHIFVQNID